MSVRETAERLRQQQQAYSEEYRNVQQGSDESLLASAYLAEHPADDGQLADAQFIKNIGGVRPMATASTCVYCFGDYQRISDAFGCYAFTFTRTAEGAWNVDAGMYALKKDWKPTRRQVRQLIELLTARTDT